VTTDRTSGVPTGADLVEAVAEYLATELLPSAQGAARYQVRVSIAALEIAGQDLRRGQAVAADHAEQLESLGVADDAELAAEIRAGLAPERYRQVRRVLERQVEAELSLLPNQERQ
jgi:hypothetical protein